jgi:hypothetical protein
VEGRGAPAAVRPGVLCVSAAGAGGSLAGVQRNT